LAVRDQIVELKAAGASRTFAEKLSGAHSDRPMRPMLRKALAALDEGDTLMVVRLDRLARSTRDLLNILHEVGDKGASFKSLHDCWADTTTPHGRLMLTILGGLAEFERSLIKARTDVGIKRAREQGIRFGRPPKLTKHQQTEALRLLDEGEPLPLHVCSEAVSVLLKSAKVRFQQPKYSLGIQCVHARCP
jgi:DNA invertase Pin-like site-specific DNA recombinase